MLDDVIAGAWKPARWPVGSVVRARRSCVFTEHKEKAVARGDGQCLRQTANSVARLTVLIADNDGTALSGVEKFRASPKKLFTFFRFLLKFLRAFQIEPRVQSKSGRKRKACWKWSMASSSFPEDASAIPRLL